MTKPKVDEGLLQFKPAGNGAAAEAVVKPKKKAKARRRRKKVASAEAPAKAAKPVDRPFPRVTLEDAMKVALAIKDKNAGNSYASEAVAKARGPGIANAGREVLSVNGGAMAGRMHLPLSTPKAR